MLVTGLILALGLFVALQISQNYRPTENANNGENTASDVPDPNATVDPVIFQSVSEQAGRLRITGTSAPNVEIGVENDGTQLLSVNANGEGEWKAEFAVNRTDNLAIDLVVNVREGANIRSDEKLFRIAPPPKDESGDANEIPALLMITAPGGPTRVFQSPFRGLPTNGGLSLGPIDYDDSGGVIFSGVSETSGRVRIFANNVAVGEIRVAQNGRWFFIAADTLPLGSYDIRTDLFVDGEVVASVTVPFERKSSQANDALALDVKFEPFMWQVRRKLLGGGYQYTAIFAPEESDPILVEE